MNPPIELEILLIEDNPSDADFMLEMMESAPRKVSQYQNFKINCKWASSLKQAFDLIKDHHFDVFLVDLSLPDSSGLETITGLVAEEPNVPIIVLTGNVSDNFWVEAIHLGVQDYLCKNEIEVKLLLRTLGQAIERYKLRIELKENMLKLENYSRRLERSNNELQNFAYIASHDLQEPLRNMMAYGERISDNYKDKFDDKGKFFIERLLNSGTRMQQLLDDLLEYSRVTSRKFNIVDLDFNRVLYQVLCDLEMIIKESSSSITLNNLDAKSDFCIVEDGVINATFYTNQKVAAKIRGDETQVRRMLQNILHNAIKYRKKECQNQININIGNNSDMSVIEILDNGIGFEEEFKDKIFEQFQRLHARSEFDGTGMGLATVKKIIELHNGKIDVRSKPGEGSSFVVHLPAKKLNYANF